MNSRRLYITVALIYVLLSVGACKTAKFRLEGSVESETPPSAAAPTTQPSSIAPVAGSQASNGNAPLTPHIRLEVLKEWTPENWQEEPTKKSPNFMRESTILRRIKTAERPSMQRHLTNFGTSNAKPYTTLKMPFRDSGFASNP